MCKFQKYQRFIKTDRHFLSLHCHSIQILGMLEWPEYPTLKILTNVAIRMKIFEQQIVENTDIDNGHNGIISRTYQEQLKTTD
ncbi:hypothetical protein AT05_08115 [Schleiferia thermophila str. Yellowstone]|nr:hypothetical protein AT05_08115 [Schleiferia thermophila str. Yellowstone]